MAGNGRWIQNARPKAGALHRQLRIARGTRIPDRVLDRVLAAPVGARVAVGGRDIPVTGLLKRRANFARNVRKRG